jgi:hypothetical protein
MSEKLCASCKKPKANRSCSLCQDDLCKSCTQFLDEEAFSFLKEIPEDLRHPTYCNPCFDEKVAPELASYEEIMERAKKIYVFFKTQRKPIPLVKKGRDPVEVKSCPDRDEIILRLAFFAAELSFNALIEVDITSEKIRNQGYEKLQYKATGFPAEIDVSKMYWDRHRD